MSGRFLDASGYLTHPENSIHLEKGHGFSSTGKDMGVYLIGLEYQRKPEYMYLNKMVTESHGNFVPRSPGTFFFF